jgi:hypothetical protein
LIRECDNCIGKGGNRFTVCRGGSGQVVHESDKTSISRELDLHRMFYNICRVLFCTAVGA